MPSDPDYSRYIVAPGERMSTTLRDFTKTDKKALDNAFGVVVTIANPDGTIRTLIVTADGVITGDPGTPATPDDLRNFAAIVLNAASALYPPPEEDPAPEAPESSSPSSPSINVAIPKPGDLIWTVHGQQPYDPEKHVVTGYHAAITMDRTLWED